MQMPWFEHKLSWQKLHACALHEMLLAGGRDVHMLAAAASPLGFVHCTDLMLCPPVINSIW